MNTLTRRDMLAGSLPLAAAGFTLLAGLQAPAGAAEPEGQSPLAASIPGGPIAAALAASFKEGKYVLPPLAYAHDALEPHIDAQTMELHHTKHHQSYVDGLNKTLDGLTALRGGEPDPVRLSALQRDLAFHSGGHLMHAIFWATLAPQPPAAPGGPLADAIARDFGSLDHFKAQFTQVATAVKGSGWAVLFYEPVGDRLLISLVNEHNLNLLPGAAPLLPLDVWEHAYYLKHQNKRADYIKAWWNVVNWDAVGRGYEAVRAAAPTGG